MTFVAVDSADQFHAEVPEPKILDLIRKEKLGERFFKALQAYSPQNPFIPKSLAVLVYQQLLSNMTADEIVAFLTRPNTPPVEETATPLERDMSKMHEIAVKTALLYALCIMGVINRLWLQRIPVPQVQLCHND
ncbi:MAG: hypothetical protein H7A36_06260 [Chlamydiales bacterium]|nr:hypothetical protein [Chlamydiales bacterium]